MPNYTPSLDLLFSALSDPTRRAIVMRLTRQPASVSELAEPFAMAMPTLLQHIRVLETSGLVATQKVGRVRTCTLRPEAMAATEQWLAAQRQLWERRLDRMEAYVNKLQAAEKASAKHKRPRK
jgi:DNA-binding transcriptional ArsR family regulator